MGILVVDDEAGTRGMIAAVLAKKGFEVHQAANGAQGLQMARALPPDLILSDVNMPEMDGFALLQAVREDPTLADVPLVFLSTLEDRDSLRTGMRLGADDFLTKPVRPSELLEVVENRVERYRKAKEALQFKARETEAMLQAAQQRVAKAEEDAGKPNISGFVVVSFAGSGGMSTVWRATRIADQQDVALKILETEATENKHGDLLQRFVKEHDLLSMLQHRGIARIYDFGITDKVAFIAMEFFPGGNLRGKLKTGVTETETVAYLGQLAEALAECHDKGIVHRDVKPENLLLRADGSAALVDFGIAKEVGDTAGLTRTGEFLGSVSYMAPERFSAQDSGPPIDVYAIGVLLYEMLTGEKPFTRATAPETLAAHLAAPVPTLPLKYAKYQALLEASLAKDPTKRLPNGRAFLQQLLEC
jgi:DNA-binding response OmpR family regulator